jgi:KaiC/GvpD/RAD55 family RecA-like ATPase
MIENQSTLIKSKDKESTNKIEVFRKESSNVDNATHSRFIVKRTSEFIEDAKHLPRPKWLIENIIREGQIVVLFGDSGVFKSVLARQMALQIAGVSTGFPLDTHASASTVLYVDVELTSRQIRDRYAIEVQTPDGKIEEKVFPYPSNFYDAQLDCVFEGDDDIDSVISDLKKAVSATRSTVLVIDNLTFLGDDLSKGDEAAKVLKRLKKMSNEMGISILVVAHTNKRNVYETLEANELTGSAKIKHAVDAQIGVAKSYTEDSTVYLKQFKVRHDPSVWGTDVFKMRLSQHETGALFASDGELDDEANHIKKRVHEGQAAELKNQRDEHIKNLKKMGLGTHKQLAAAFGVSDKTIQRITKGL